MFKRSEAEKEDGIERKSLALIGILMGFVIGIMVELGLWHVIDGNFKCIGICMLMGVLIGGRINTSTGRIDLAGYKKLRKIGILTFIAAVVGCVAIFFVKIIPAKDYVDTNNLPGTKFVYSQDNRYAYQSGEDCAGYATAYVLRNEGIEAEGEAVYKNMGRFFGKVAVHNIIDEFQKYDITARAYHGNIDTLKSRISEGKPVIALVTITIGTHKGLHYLVVVGYDSEYIYLADSTGPKTNIFDKQQYNRKVTYREFEELWETNIYPVNNIYIVVE
ncbi:MAG: C39 family peptidase [Lachnospira sp.]